MTRPILPQNRLSPEADSAISGFYAADVKTIQEALEKNAVVVVGMAGNPFVRKARQALAQAGIEYTYIGFGGYLSQWKRRLAIKLWSGWPTFPQVFVKGLLIGGADDLKRALQDGSLKKRLGP